MYRHSISNWHRYWNFPMIKFELVFICFLLTACQNNSSTDAFSMAENPVIAHRGAWKSQGHPENSIAALKHAIKLNCAGSEFDVRMTSDNVLIVTHDPDYHGLVVEESTYNQLSEFKLSNGEILPTLEDYIKAGLKQNDSTALICEIKPSKIEGRNEKMAQDVLDLVARLGAKPYIGYYISFGYDILKEIKRIDSSAKVQYLDGSKNPQVLSEDQMDGLDYYISKFKQHPEWIDQAKKYNLVLNAWTVNKKEDIEFLIANDFDFITTNEPELVLDLYKTKSHSNNYKLVWSDEFNYSGKPDSTKWTYDIGFIANQEKQYYTDSLKNAFVEDGHLIIEARKETIANKDFGNDAIKKWASYKKEIDSAPYTSARIKTEGLAMWKYGLIEVRAKLPKGRGTWPAIWMLSEQREELGWPKSGEIDIMEHVGYNNDTIHGTIHTEAYNHTKGTQKGKTAYIDQPNDQFHVFAIEWTPEKIDFMLDGKVYNQIQNEHKTIAEWPFDQKFHLILNVAIGGMWGGRQGVDDSIFPQRMTVDYVRVFQKKSNDETSL